MKQIISRRPTGLFVVIAAAAALAAAGCQTKPGDTLEKYETAQASVPDALTAPADGTYNLMATNMTGPIYSVHLQKGATFGFREIGGKLSAFAQRTVQRENGPVRMDESTPLNRSEGITYTWIFAG